MLYCKETKYFFLNFLKILCLIENTFFTWLYINDYFQFVPKININWKFQNLKLFWRVHGLLWHKIWDWSHPLYRRGQRGGNNRAAAGLYSTYIPTTNTSRTEQKPSLFKLQIYVHLMYEYISNIQHMTTNIFIFSLIYYYIQQLQHWIYFPFTAV